MVEQYTFYKTADGHNITLSFHAYEHIESAHPGCTNHLQEAIQQFEYASIPEEQDCFLIGADLGRPLGYTHLIPLEASDEVLYSIRKGRSLPSRIVKKSPILTNLVTIICKKKKDSDSAFIRTAWLGDNVQYKELTDPYLEDHEKEAARLFWCGDQESTFGHAFAYDPDIMGSILPLSERQVMELASAFNPLLLDAREQRDEARKERDEARKERDEARKELKIALPNYKPLCQSQDNSLSQAPSLNSPSEHRS